MDAKSVHVNLKVVTKARLMLPLWPNDADYIRGRRVRTEGKVVSFRPTDDPQIIVCAVRHYDGTYGTYQAGEFDPA